MNMPPAGRVFGTVSLSTTLIQGVGDRGEVPGGGLDFVVRHVLRESGHQARIELSRIRGLPQAVLEVGQLLDDVFVGKSGDVGILRAALAVGIVAEAAGKDRGLRSDLAMGDDVGHRRMVLGEPVGRAVPVGHLCAGELEFGSRHAEQLGVVRHHRGSSRSRRRQHGRRRRIDTPGPGHRRPIRGLDGSGKSGGGAERQNSSGYEELRHRPPLFPGPGRSRILQQNHAGIAR